MNVWIDGPGKATKVALDPRRAIGKGGEADVYELGDAMDARGWKLDRQMNPPALHVMVTPAHQGEVLQKFLADVKDCVSRLKAGEPAPDGSAAMYGMVGQMVSPIDLTYLSDTVVLLRFFEANGRIRRALSVVKRRTGSHEDTIREFRIDGQGLRVGPPLEQFRGVLMGVPTFEGQRASLLEERGTDNVAGR